VGQAAQAVAAQDAVDGRASHAQVIPEPMGALAAAPAGDQDPTDLGGRQRVGAAMGSRGPVGQPRCTFSAIAAQPFVALLTDPWVP
jgi:hypothetical protein